MRVKQEITIVADYEQKDILLALDEMLTQVFADGAFEALQIRTKVQPECPEEVLTCMLALEKL